MDSWIEPCTWFLLAARQAYPGAPQKLEILAQRLNVKEIDQAEAAVDAWRLIQ